MPNIDSVIESFADLFPEHTGRIEAKINWLMKTCARIETEQAVQAFTLQDILAAIHAMQPVVTGLLAKHGTPTDNPK